MCQWYAHVYTCKHTTYALGKYCASGNLVQAPCKKRSIWQTIRMGEDCEDCAVPVDRNAGSGGGGGGGVVERKPAAGRVVVKGRKVRKR
jgi:hypothetical protein